MDGVCRPQAAKDYLRATVQTPIKATEEAAGNLITPSTSISDRQLSIRHNSHSFLCKWIWLLNVGLFDANIYFLATQLSWKGPENWLAG